MNLKYLVIITALVTAIGTTAFAQQQPAAQNTDMTAEQLENKLDSELASRAVNAPAETPQAEDPLIEQYKLIKERNFKSIEFELAKELALNRSGSSLATQEDLLYVAALKNLTAAIGAVSDPQKEETYFEYQENPDTGEFVIVLVKDAYVKAERGDICQVATQVHLRTSVQAEFTQKLTAMNPPTEQTPVGDSTHTAATSQDTSVQAVTAPTKITEIECYNSQRPTYSQKLVN